jgi:hypothetical protein
MIKKEDKKEMINQKTLKNILDLGHDFKQDLGHNLSDSLNPCSKLTFMIFERGYKER